ncbi:hypothetical protein [Rhizobium sp. 2MFCol3.1]|uniref:hypothetical protein n=1 Tax=Rhizobium sp. 2MFCol3.1 TaxID=1246459 RepID=UPI000365CE97|nr:hypothetical protein [Rhizobium sp. 2MFCol3.1]
MHIQTETHHEMSCQIVRQPENFYTGTLMYKVFEVGQISGASADAVRLQFKSICELVDGGGMVRHGTIMLGYHNRALKGDVLRVDGEIIGEWECDELEWCHFTALEASEVTLSAPSPWMLQDAIADWESETTRS